MLEIGLVPKASASTGLGRFYPHEGYLGLSPVVVAGTIVARLPPLYPSLPIRQVVVSIRCLATRTIGSDVETVLWEKAKRLWEPAGDKEYEELGDWSTPFTIVAPVEAAREAASAQWTRDLKVVWQLQVAFEHKPIPYVGNRMVKTYVLDLHSYANIPIPPPSPPSATILPGAQVFVNPPHGTFGPGESFTLSLHIKPDDPAASIRRTTLVVERRTQLVDPCVGDVKERKVSPPFANWRRSSSPRPFARLDDPVVHTTKLLETSSAEAVPGSGGTFWVSLTGTLPKRGGTWEAGETGTTKLTITDFDCKVRIVLKSKSKGSKELVCPPFPIVLVGSTQEERIAAQAVLAAEADAHPKASLPKRRHRSSRRGLYMHEGTTDIAEPAAYPSSRSRRTRATSASPVLPPVSVPASAPTAGVKPILLPSNPAPQPQSISFSFPAKHSSRPALPITTLIHPPSPKSASGTPTLPAFGADFDNAYLPSGSEIPEADMSFIRSFQSSGRRISTSTSEEEEIQPSRSRVRLNDSEPNPFFPPTPVMSAPYTHNRNSSDIPRGDNSRTGERPSLPSLDVLGLRLPPVPEYDHGHRRPRTAPVHTAFTSRSHSSGAGSDRKGFVPPPLSGGLPFLSAPGKALVSNRAARTARPVTSGTGTALKGYTDEEDEEGAFAFRG